MAKVARTKCEEAARKYRREPPSSEWRVQAGSIPFDYQARTRLVFGVNSVERVGELARELGAKKILLVTDPGSSPPATRSACNAC